MVDGEKQHTLLAVQCLKAMQLLKQDICGINNPCLLNSEVDNLPSRIKANIPVHIQYASRYWMFHLTHALISDTLADLLRKFCTKYLLYWVEACSLLGELRNILVGLNTTLEFLLVCDWAFRCIYNLTYFIRKRKKRNLLTWMLCLVY